MRTVVVIRPTTALARLPNVCARNRAFSESFPALHHACGFTHTVMILSHIYNFCRYQTSNFDSSFILFVSFRKKVTFQILYIDIEVAQVNCTTLFIYYTNVQVTHSKTGRAEGNPTQHKFVDSESTRIHFSPLSITHY